MARPLSVQLYTVRDLLAADRDGTLRQLADIGYSAVEFFDPTDDPAGARKVLDDVGLEVSSAHGFLAETEPRRILEAVATLGTDLVIVPGGIPAENFAGRDGIEQAADLLNGFVEQAASYGLQVGYHNHWWEIEPVFDGRHAIELLADLLAPQVFLELDTYWAAVGGADVPALLGRLGDRVRALHVKDGPIAKEGAQSALGAGKMPVAEIVAAAPEALRVVELDWSDGDIMQVLADSRAFLAKLP